ncbi:aspartate/glutamate racemase family protein [Sulfitobacter sp. D35]|uniref:aspartate/glutamate racemase family protein n=1 Tax=Sulfitobacter sp. D35 TaxID=3083252 RepID=UPI00296F8322|nr:aspartate/glutamate racemase family protein [Sulfitobacter sp. D35]MDW4499228.1 aspartate/glutamate racemase family protein [Sulfitobacter sp. D35]
MSIVLINPNSTESMTEAMLETARQAAPSTAFEGWTSHEGPPAIQGAEDGEAATPPLLKLVAAASGQGAKGIIIGCFDDTGLAEAARVASCPVVGIGQAAYHFCVLRQWRFGVVTTLPVSVPVLERNIASYGLPSRTGIVRASGVPVLALEEDPGTAIDRVIEVSRAMVREDRVDAVILGCGGMVAVAEAARQALDVPVIDPLETAARLMTWLAAASA